MNWATRSVPLKWVIAPEPDTELLQDIAVKTGLEKIIVKILFNRQIDTVETTQKFLHPTLADLQDPFLLNGMDKAVERILDALRENEKIMVYGDYDVDGITAASLLYLVLNKLGALVSYYLPNRLIEGYGLSIDGINEANEKGVSLIISVDTGVTAVQEVEFARSLGIECILTDHHEPGEVLPKSVALVNPKLKECNYMHGDLSGVGVAWKLAEALYQRLQQDRSELEEHLDLVALGTSADIVPLVGENRVLTKFGIRQIARTTKPGLKSLAFVSGLMGKEIGTGQVVFILAPRINAIGRLGDAELAIKLLTTKDEKLASEIARKLDRENQRRKNIDEKTLNDALEQIRQVVNPKEDRAIVLASEGWHQGVIGIVASRLVEKFHLPTVMIAIDNGEGKGSARSIPGFHLCDALKECEDLLLRYGGHKYAAGLTIKPENINSFRERLKEVSKRMLTDEDLVAKLFIDSGIELSQIDNKLLDVIETFAPFGPQNMRPVFLTRNCEILGQPYCVGKNHLKMKVRKGDAVFDVIGFGFGDWARRLSSRGSLVDLVFVIEYNSWDGHTRIQLRLKDIKLAAGDMRQFG
ncbi:MAG: single-stranded-DNA-specific exonuclease RecJ [candidate division Zixibacteria bacterium HGW-Zixibacteria-1]|nr:MAG: single-stranded-DNA-specific exonuclease RecJ [candidate division Zixibacteria bacterium HGW-Zixibacteria-1]